MKKIQSISSGAVPGDSELITVKGLKVLQSCDVIIYDSFVDENIWNFYNIVSLQKIFVRKRKGKHSFSQDEINKILLDYAKGGGIIVRLKGGDPFIFGRGGEEIYYLMKNGIEVEVIPDITSATAEAAKFKIPLTHRELGRSFLFLTGYSSFNAEDETGFPDYN